MSGPQKRQENGRDASGRFQPGHIANPGGRPRAVPGFTARAKELSLDVLEHFATLARGRSMAAVRAGELVLAYGHGKPEASLHVTATRLGPMPEAFAGAAATLLERALEEADRPAEDPADPSATVPQTVALGGEPSEKPSAGAVLDVTAEPAPTGRGHSLVVPTDEGGGS